MDTLITLCIGVTMALGLIALGLGVFVIVPTRPGEPTTRRSVSMMSLILAVHLLANPGFAQERFFTLEDAERQDRTVAGEKLAFWSMDSKEPLKRCPTITSGVMSVFAKSKKPY